MRSELEKGSAGSIARIEPTDPDVALTPAEASVLLGVTVGTLGNWRWSGRGPPYVKIGAAVRYVRGSTLAWRDAQTRVSTST